MANKHTPGPWQHDEASVRLIAAAPALLDALRRLRAETADWKHSPGCVDIPPGYEGSRCCPLAQADAAIAAAEGK